jgi:hypothetical protein
VNNSSQNISAGTLAEEEPRIESERVRFRDVINMTENSFNSCNETSQQQVI